MKPGRNDACPCGSGRKFKKCCELRVAQTLQTKPDAEALYAAAVKKVEQGRPEDAEEICREILAIVPNHHRAIHLLGAVATQTGRHEHAVDLIQKAISIDPHIAGYHNTLGSVFKKLGQPASAATEFKEALRLMPDHVYALANLGALLRECDQPDDALPLLKRAVDLDPAYAFAQANLGFVLFALDRVEEGQQHVRNAIGSSSYTLEIISGAATVLMKSEHYAAAAEYLERWAGLEPDNSVPYEGLGSCYEKLGRKQDVTRCLVEALIRNPKSLVATNNLAAGFANAGLRDDAFLLFRKAIETEPNSPEVWTNLGQAMKRYGNSALAMRCYEIALTLNPEHVEAHWDRALALLDVGRLAEGWLEYEWGWKSEARTPKRPFEQPRWEGTDPAGKTILVFMEQGLGDHILFASMLPDLARGGAHCIVECDRRLVPLFSRSFPNVEVVPQTTPPHPRTLKADIDFQIPAGSLGMWLRPELEFFPRHRGYLSPDPALAEHWRKRLGGLGQGLKVGICWRSMLNSGIRSMYYSQLSQWGPILTVPGAHFVNLQYDNCAAELRAAENLFGVPIHNWNDIDLMRDQDGLAALMSNLDLVLSAGTAVDQLAGALGKPAWVLLRGTSDIWGLGTGACPWYPSVRPFHCPATGRWEPVTETIASELTQLIALRSSAEAIAS